MKSGNGFHFSILLPTVNNRSSQSMIVDRFTFALALALALAFGSWLLVVGYGQVYV